MLLWLKARHCVGFALVESCCHITKRKNKQECQHHDSISWSKIEPLLLLFAAIAILLTERPEHIAFLSDFEVPLSDLELGFLAAKLPLAFGVLVRERLRPGRTSYAIIEINPALDAMR